MKNITPVFIILIFLPIQSYACSCIIESYDEQFKKADIVFTGKVISTDRFDEKIKPKNRKRRSLTIFDPSKVFKTKSKYYFGTHANEKIVALSDNTLLCLFSFQEGENYIIFANESIMGMYVISGCSGSEIINGNPIHIEKMIEGVKNRIQSP